MLFVQQRDAMDRTRGQKNITMRKMQLGKGANYKMDGTTGEKMICENPNCKRKINKKNYTLIEVYVQGKTKSKMKLCGKCWEAMNTCLKWNGWFKNGEMSIQKKT